MLVLSSDTGDVEWINLPTRPGVLLREFLLCVLLCEVEIDDDCVVVLVPMLLLGATSQWWPGGQGDSACCAFRTEVQDQEM